ncbi:MAG TPA: N-acetylglucosamine-6-phosphate deacetylase, partial [Clostridia bacterium]|nr:N-acetylglucosamine-6-phosphate deacetylase [Clostridia bacterium]
GYFMCDLFLKNAQIYQDGVFVNTTVTVVAGKIDSLGEDNHDHLFVVDAADNFVIPGFIDLHTHGAIGIDCNEATAGDFRRLCLYFAGQGTTAWLCSIAADSEEHTIKALSEAADAIEQGGPGAELLGIHLEGPFVSQTYRATFQAPYVLEGNEALLRRYQDVARGHIRSITVAPEVPGVMELIPICETLGIRVCLGHSNATWREAMDAREAGALCVTHLGNAMRPLHHREPGLMGAALETDFYTELICDGVHLHPAFVRLVDRLKGTDRLIAVTDSMMATGLGDGDYKLGSRQVRVTDGQSRRENGALAGSTLTMHGALCNLRTFTGKTLQELLACVSGNAARWLGVDDRKGAIATGMDADLLILGKDLGLLDIFCKGERIAKNL